MATIAEITGLVPVEHRWVTVTANRLVPGDVTRSVGSWVRTVESVEHRYGRVHIRYVGGSDQALRPDWFMTVDTGGRTRGKRRKRS